MSRERMQEHFTDLYEGSIDPGMKQQILSRMESDHDLRADYDQFCELMQGLDFLRDEVIETPANLTSLIEDRLESGAKRSAPTLGTFWRNLGLGALGTAAVLGAVMMINNRANTQANMVGGDGPTPAPQAARKLLDTIEVKLRAKGPTLVYEASGAKTVTVVNAEDQKLLKKFDLVADGRALSCPLENKGDAPSVFQIEATGETAMHEVVLPGTGKDYEAAGSGDVVAFAKVLAVKFGTVVHIQVPKDSTSDLKWDVSQTSAPDAAKAALSSSEYTVTGDDKLLVIQRQSH